MFCSTKIFFTGIEWCSLDASFREPRESDKMVSLIKKQKGRHQYISMSHPNANSSKPIRFVLFLPKSED